MNCVAVLSSNFILSSAIRISPEVSHPIVENTSTLFPLASVLISVLSKRVFVEIENNPLTVSGASTIFHIVSPSAVLSG